jgi:uncharacterized protein (TIGR02391 family)
MDSWPLTDEEIQELPVDELGIRLLHRFSRGNPRSISRHNLTQTGLSMWLGLTSTSDRVFRALGEAYDWLMYNGLIANLPGSHNAEFAYVTDRGKDLLQASEPLKDIAAARRLSAHMHPLIARRVRTQFLIGEYESAVLLAFREVEIRVRQLGGFPDSLIGVKLMREAFRPQGGALTNATLDDGEKQAVMELFSGAIGAFKNPSSHRQVDYGDATVAAEAVLLADLLLRMLDQYLIVRSACQD